MSPRVRTAACFLFAALAVASVPSARADGEGTWPFGASGDNPFMSRGRDLYNLGILGAKARGEDDPGPAARTDMGGGITRFEPGERASDDGPTRLVVELLFPDGPAAKAGLAVGDVIVGAGRGVFKDAGLAPLAEVLSKAEAGKAKGVVRLLVERQGSPKRSKVEVLLPVAGKPAGKPTEGEGRQAILDAALAWLAGRQAPDGGFQPTLSGTNGAVVLTSLAGLAWLAGGSDLETGPYKEHVERAADFVAENAGVTMRLPPGMGGRGGDRLSKMRGMDQTNWGHAHAAIFLGELHARNAKPHVRAALDRSAAALLQTQEPTGGWAHGPGGPNPLGYTELNIVTGLALAGLGLARQAGMEVPEEAVEKAEAYLKASSGGDGGVGYSSQGGQRGQGNVGRTAGSWLGYRTLGRAKDGWGRKMQKWLERNVHAVFGGHASLMQHVLLGGVAAHALGKQAAKSYWEVAERDLVLARAPDGSLQPRPWSESLSMASNSDVTFGEVWTTAAWAVVLGCHPEQGRRPGLPAWMGLKAAK